MFNVNFFFIINVRFFTEYGDIAYFEISDNFYQKKKKFQIIINSRKDKISPCIYRKNIPAQQLEVQVEELN